MTDKSKLRIHFVCSGNLFRSRLAEAYLKSKALNISVSSSGIRASLQGMGPISFYAMRILYRRNLIPFMKNMWSDTTEKDFKNADLLIFFGEKNYNLCREKFNFDSDYLIWDIPDFYHNELNGQPTDISEEIKYLKMSEDTYVQIKDKVDKLVKERKLV